jgi:hypothetical protein
LANALFDLGRQAFLDADIDWSADNIKVVLVDNTVDTPLPATDQFLSDIAVGARIATTANLAGKTSTAGVADANDTLFAAPAAGTQCESLVIYQDTGVAATSRLIAYIDTATGLPVTTNGADIDVIWDAGVNRIFKL